MAALSKKLDEVLGTTRLQPVILVGAGNLGTALLGYYEGFAKEGFEIVATFDMRDRAAKASAARKKIKVRPMAEVSDFVP